MSLNVAETQQLFPFAYDQVWDGLLATLGPAGFTVKTYDKAIGRITATAAMSGFSWGENLALQLKRVDDTDTELDIQSNLKVGANVFATARKGQNAERIIGTLSAYLQGGTKGNVTQSIVAAPKAGSPPILYILLGVAVVVMFLAMLGLSGY